MPEFTYPWLLVLLLLVPPLLWHWRRRSRGAVRFSSAALFVGLPAGRAPWMRRGGLVLRGLGAVTAVIALAGPRWPDEGSRIPAEGVSIAAVVDVSRSMAEKDFPFGEEKIARLDGVKKVLHLFVAGGEAPGGAMLAGRPEDLVALVTFATRPETVCPLTLDHRVLLQMLKAQETSSAADVGTTNPGDAIAWALGVLKMRPTHRRLIVLLTDGEANVPRAAPPAGRPARRQSRRADLRARRRPRSGTGRGRRRCEEGTGDTRDAGADDARRVFPRPRAGRPGRGVPADRRIGEKPHRKLSISPASRSLHVVRASGTDVLVRGAGDGGNAVAEESLVRSPWSVVKDIGRSPIWL